MQINWKLYSNHKYLSVLKINVSEFELVHVYYLFIWPN